nr:hypothetical protein GCM10020185_70550 [Pseudomonas brassicacearum subsp. brassicacearum]
MAAFMACAHAKFTGELGVCIATSGPGASHLVTGLYDARMDHMPVLAISGQQARAALGGHYQQELDLVSLFKDVAGAFVQQASVPAQVRHLLDRAVRTAVGERRVTALILPNDLQDMEYTAPRHKHGTVHSGVGYRKPSVVPYEEDLRKAAEVLNAGKKVAILVGAGALHATDEVIAIAEKLGAGVAKALLGKAAVPDDLPWVTGTIGLLGTEPSDNLMAGCDTLLMIGSGFPYAEFLPPEGQARGVQIDIQADMLSLRYPMEVNLHGDSVDTLRALLPLIEEKNPTAPGARRSSIGANAGSGPWKKTRPGQRQADQSAAGHLRTVAATTGARHHYLRFRLLRQLVRPGHQDPPWHDVFAVRWPGVDGRGRALCHRGEVLPSAAAGDRPGG